MRELASGISIIIFIYSTFVENEAAQPCLQRFYGYDSQVCVCNSTYCDSIQAFTEQDLENGAFLHYESNMAGKRLQLSKEYIFSEDNPPFILQTIINIFNIFTATYIVDPTTTFQKILGFGGALTDSSAYLISNLSKEIQDLLLRQYFSTDGLRYSFIRIPIGSSDFSSHLYTYDDVPNDSTLSKFNLTAEEYGFKIPYIKTIMNMSSLPMKIMAAPWIAPQWMVECRFTCLFPFITRLKDKYYDLYAHYLLKYVEAYRKEGIKLWGLSIQNEPADGLIGVLTPVNTGWYPWEQAIFIQDYLGPLLHSQGYDDIKLLIHDDQRVYLILCVSLIMAFPNVYKYVSGIAVHWYLNWMMSPLMLDWTHGFFPDLFILPSESSVQLKGLPAKLGLWKNAEWYASDILDNLNNWAVGWIDWNIALDKNGGPTFTSNNLECPVIINNTANEFYKQPMYYALAHFSHFIPPDSRHISMYEWKTSGVQTAAFLTPNNNIVIVLLNKNNEDIRAIIKTESEAKIHLHITRRSIHTIIYKSLNLLSDKNKGTGT